MLCLFALLVLWSLDPSVDVRSTLLSFWPRLWPQRQAGAGARPFQKDLAARRFARRERETLPHPSCQAIALACHR